MFYPHQLGDSGIGAGFSCARTWWKTAMEHWSCQTLKAAVEHLQRYAVVDENLKFNSNKIRQCIQTFTHIYHCAIRDSSSSTILSTSTANLASIVLNQDKLCSSYNNNPDYNNNHSNYYSNNLIPVFKKKNSNQIKLNIKTSGFQDSSSTTTSNIAL